MKRSIRLDDVVGKTLTDFIYPVEYGQGMLLVFGNEFCELCGREDPPVEVGGDYDTDLEYMSRLVREYGHNSIYRNALVTPTESIVARAYNKKMDMENMDKEAIIHEWERVSCWVTDDGKVDEP